MVQPTDKPRPDPVAAKYGRMVRQMRQDLYLTQTQLGERMGHYSASVISRIEQGYRGIRMGELQLLANALEVPVERLAALSAHAEGVSDPFPRQRTRGRQQLEPTRKPAQLPMTPAGFVGRDAELEELDGWYHATRPRRRTRGGMRLVLITGTAGVGKSTLAVRWAHQIAEDFPDGSLHFDLRGFDATAPPADPANALAAFLQGLGTTETVSSTQDGRSAFFRSEAANKQLLIVLDNAISAEQVRPLLPGTSGCLVVVTSRNSLDELVVWEDAYPFRLGRFSVADARKLLVRRAGEERVARESHAAKDLIDACSRLPLAVAAIGSRVKLRPQLSLRSLATEVSESRSRLDALGAIGGEQTVRAVLECSYNRLSPRVQQFFRLIAVHPGPHLSVESVASLVGIPRHDARQMLGQLASANLLQESAPRQYQFHDLFQQLAVDLLRDHEDALVRTAALKRLLDHYIRSAYAAAALLPASAGEEPRTPPEPQVLPEIFENQADAKEWFENEHSSLLSLLQFAEREAYFSACWTLARYFDPHLDLRGYFFDLESIWRIGLRAADMAEIPEAQAMARHRLGHALESLGHIDEGLEQMQHAADIRRSRGDLAGAALISISMADILDRRGEADAALGYARRANHVAEQSCRPALIARTRNACAMLLARTGRTTEALELVAGSLAIHYELNDQFGIAVARDTEAYTLAAQGRYREAIDRYTTAIELFETFEAIQQEARSTERLAQAYQAAGDVHAARNMALTAIELYQSLETEDYGRVEELNRFLDKLPNDT